MQLKPETRCFNDFWYLFRRFRIVDSNFYEDVEIIEQSVCVERIAKVFERVCILFSSCHLRNEYVAFFNGLRKALVGEGRGGMDKLKLEFFTRRTSLLCFLNYVCNFCAHHITQKWSNQTCHILH